MTKRKRKEDGTFLDVGKYRAIVGISYKDEEYEAGKNFDFPEGVKASTIKQLIKDGKIAEVDDQGEVI